MSATVLQDYDPLTLCLLRAARRGRELREAEKQIRTTLESGADSGERMTVGTTSILHPSADGCQSFPQQTD